VITYGINNEQALLKACNIHVGSKGTSFELAGDFGTVALQTKITGIFNVYNILSAVGAALSEGVDIDVIKRALEKFQSVPGRFELIDCGQPFSVIVDFAHTPDGLENILKTAKEFAKGRIIIVFGCGGDRDRTKRPIMGKLAVQYADVIIATSDNPRTEDPAQILNEVENGIKEALTPGKVYEKIIDRKTAIARAIGMANHDDIILIAGKGHETYQILKDKTIHFDDREVARDILREMK
jgi:UDP-N-acetylmuramoyl-L-alanyl-D-glutamate--2,6-diaminopimelate ligase/murE/murF fusion protein